MSNIATTVYDKQVVQLSNGDEITLRPMPLGALRRFMAEFDKISTVNENSDAIDVFLKMSTIAINSIQPENKNYTSEQLEDILDMDTVHRILKVCGDLDLKATVDPKATTVNQEGGTS